MHSPGSWRPNSAPSLLILSGSSLAWWTGGTKERGGSICGWAFLSPGHKATRCSSLFSSSCSSPLAYALSPPRPPLRPRLSTLAQHLYHPFLPPRSLSFPNASLRFQPAMLSSLPHSSLVSAAHLTPNSVSFLRSALSALAALRPLSLRQPRPHAQRSSPNHLVSSHLALANVHYLRARRDSQLLVAAFGRSVLYTAPLCTTLSRSPWFDGISADCPLQLTGHPGSDTFLQCVEYRPLFFPRCFTRTFMDATTARCAYSQ